MRALLFGLALSGLMAAPVLACGTATKGAAATAAPTVAAELDELLPKAELSEADLAKVKDLRARIETLVKANKLREARVAEEEAMAVLGYRKALMRCGPGSYSWMKVKTG